MGERLLQTFAAPAAATRGYNSTTGGGQAPSFSVRQAVFPMSWPLLPVPAASNTRGSVATRLRVRSAQLLLTSALGACTLLQLQVLQARQHADVHRPAQLAACGTPGPERGAAGGSVRGKNWGKEARVVVGSGCASCCAPASAGSTGTWHSWCGSRGEEEGMEQRSMPGRCPPALWPQKGHTGPRRWVHPVAPTLCLAGGRTQSPSNFSPWSPTPLPNGPQPPLADV